MKVSDSRLAILSMGTRMLGGLFAFILIGTGIVLLFKPLDRISTTTRNGKTTERKERSTDPSNASTVLIISGSVLGLYVLNGLRIARFSAAGVSAEAIAAGEKAQSFIEGKTSPVEVNVPVEETTEAPQPTEPPLKILPTKEGEVAVYGLMELPPAVLRDALANWPATFPFPNDLSNFDFATRRIGKGNHAWTLKFKGADAISVSYGGRAKENATVH